MLGFYIDVCLIFWYVPRQNNSDPTFSYIYFEWDCQFAILN